jgi:hypothetical protein
MGLVAYTINGFPQDDFHQKVVKHRVYRPAWWEPARLEYTRDLVRILDRLLPSGVSGSISTLPIGWGSDALDGAGSIPGAKQEDRSCCRLPVSSTNSMSEQVAGFALH